jgi:hypothetical protein
MQRCARLVEVRMARMSRRLQRNARLAVLFDVRLMCVIDQKMPFKTAFFLALNLCHSNQETLHPY